MIAWGLCWIWFIDWSEFAGVPHSFSEILNNCFLFIFGPLCVYFSSASIRANDRKFYIGKLFFFEKEFSLDDQKLEVVKKGKKRIHLVYLINDKPRKILEIDGYWRHFKALETYFANVRQTKNSNQPIKAD